MKTNSKSTLKELIDKSFLELNLPNVDYTLEHPANEAHGDYSTNVAMILFSQLKKSADTQFSNPRELAKAIASKLKANSSQLISNISVAGPGFINFTISQVHLINLMSSVIEEGSKYGQNNLLKDKKISVEYTDPNPFKEFHIGHLYSNIVGESIAKLKEVSGATVWRGDFFGDVGMHAAKSIWGLLQKFEDEGVDLNELDQKPLKERIEYFGQAYAKGATAYKDDETAKEEIKQLNFLIFKAAQELVLPNYNKEPEIDFDQFIKPSQYKYEEIREIYRVGRQWSLDYFETIYARLGTKFDGYYPESLTGEYGYDMVIEGLEKGIFEKGEGGAIIFPGEKHGLHNRVFINALGLPTYETKDFGLAVAKFVDFEYDESYNITGNEINEYFKVVLTALRMLKPDLGNVTIHIGHGMVRLPEGKMSSRTGKILRGEWLLDEAKKSVLSILDESASIPESNREETAEVIGQGAVKYALLKQNIGENVSFDFKTSISFQGNSGPYLQYTHARCKSVLRKAWRGHPVNNENSHPGGSLRPIGSDSDSIAPLQNNTSLASSNSELFNEELNPEELSLLRILPRFPEVVARGATEYAPHHICTYLYDLAQRFNTFYNKHSILGKEDKLVDEHTKQLRLQLTAATAQILKNGLNLLGITAPDEM